MKNILIMLVMVVVLGAAGLFGAASMADSLTARQRYGMIGACVGAGMGLLGGALITARLDAKRKSRDK